MTDANGNVTTYAYPIDTAAEYKVVMTPPVGPEQVTDGNFANGTEDVYTLAHDGTGNPLSFTRTKLDVAGRETETDQYYDPANFSFDGSTPGGNYYITTYGYDSGGRQYQVTDPLGTITTTDYDGFGRPIDKKIGNGYTTQTVERDTYDNGGVGDGNLTQVTDIPGPDSLGTPLPNRVTTDYYNWQDELVASDNGVRLTVDTLNNLDETTQENVYNDKVSQLPAYVSPDGFANGNVATVSSASGLRQETKYDYNDDGEQTAVTQVGVNQTTGAPLTGTGSTLASTSTFDADGRVIASSSPTGLWTKNVYDGAGRVVTSYSTDNAGNNPASVAGDHVFTQTETTYDADGDATLAVTRDRAAGDNSSAGDLQDNAARVSSVENKYDTDDRLIETDNFGTNAVTSDGSGALVTKQTYDSAGNVQYTTDATGTQTQYVHDMLGRATGQVDDYDTTQPANSPSANKTIGYLYNGDNEVTQVTAADYFPTTAGHSSAETQRTIYSYGTTSSLDKSKLSNVQYPDGSTQGYLYDWLGDQVQMTMQDGTQHHYGFDQLGRQVSDFANHFGTGVDTTVQALVTAYDVLDRPILMTSEGQVSNGSGGTKFGDINQVKDVYDAFGNLTEQDQAGAGDVGSAGTLSVKYNYSSSNPTQLVSMTYPDGRKEYYTYSGIDANIGRVTSANDPDSSNNSGQAIEQYSYLGLSTVVGKTRPQMSSQTTTETITPDTYGRVGSVQWSTTGGVGTTDSFTYTYDNVGDVLNAVNNVNNQASESYGYDTLHRETSFLRGTATSSGVSNGSIVNVNWTYDSQGNKFDGTTSGASTATAKYGTNYTSNNHKDANNTADGDERTVSFAPFVSSPVNLTYDAWGRVVKATGAANIGITTLPLTHTYSYDALGREISDNEVTTSGSTTHVVSKDRLFYNGSNVIEERDGDTGDVTAQYVWSGAGPNTLILRDSDTSPTAAGDGTYIPQIMGEPCAFRRPHPFM